MRHEIRPAALLRLLAVLLLVSTLAGCKDSQAVKQPGQSGTPSASSTGAPPPPTVLEPGNLTREQTASTLRIRAVFGALPPSEFTAALLHREDTGNPHIGAGHSRLAVTLLHGWSEEQVRNSSALFTIARNRATETQTNVANHQRAQLMSFNDQTKLAVFLFSEDFAYSLDAGFRTKRTGPREERSTVIRTSRPDTEGAALPDPRTRTSAPFLVEAFARTGDSPFQLPPSKVPGEDSVNLLVEKGDHLVGFLVAGENGTSSLVPVDQLQVAINTPEVALRGVAFGELIGPEIKMGVTIDAASEEKGNWRVSLLQVIDPSAELQAKAQATPATGAHAPISDRSYVTLTKVHSGTQWQARLKIPQQEGEEILHMLQLQWPILPHPAQAYAQGKPFFVKLTRKGNEVVPTAIGVENLNLAQEQDAGPAKIHPLGGVAQHLQEIAGGREVLIQMQSAPFWKRYSYESDQWLPLPMTNPANVSITGSLTSLYVLDFGAAEIRRYGLKDMRLQASAKLPAGERYVWAATGCNTSRGPLYLATLKNVHVFDPETLQRMDGTRAPIDPARHFKREDMVNVAGDGLGLSITRPDATTPIRLACINPYVGVEQQYFDEDSHPAARPGVSASYGLLDSWMYSTATPNGEILHGKEPPLPYQHSGRWILPNSPTVIRLMGESSTTIPPTKSHLQFFSHFDTEPFASVLAAELLGPSSESHFAREMKRWVTYDPYSSRVGFLSEDRKRWIVRQVTAAKNLKRPVLVNWPDALLEEGQAWEFTPVILGGNGFMASLIGQKEAMLPTTTAATISLKPDAREVASTLLMTLNLEQKKGAAVPYQIPLHFASSPRPIAVPQTAAISHLDTFAAGFKTLQSVKDGVEGLATSWYSFSKPIQGMLVPNANYLALVSPGQQVHFLSLQTRAIAGSVTVPANATLFAGADALFEYNPAVRSITRISVPQGRRERSIPLPPNVRLHGLGVGPHSGSPMTLVLEKVLSQTSGQVDQFTLSTTEFQRSLVVLDSRTLQAGALPQPRVHSPDNGIGGRGLLNWGTMLERPLSLPTSHTGFFVNLPHAFVVHSQRGGAAARFPEGFSMASFSDKTPAKGSIGGIRFSTEATAFVAGRSEQSSHTDSIYVTPCGRYRLSTNPQSAQRDLLIKTVEDDAVLFRLGRVALMREELRGDMKGWRTYTMLSDNGPLAILASGGHALQLVDLDIPKLAKSLAPESFHVTSQAAPCMIEGGVLEYQIQVNNPEVVAGYRLREAHPGATLSEKGLLRFRSPTGLAEPALVSVPVEIFGKQGQTILHTVSVLVLPKAFL